MSEVGITSKYHQFELVIYEILDFESHMYEELEYFGNLCILCTPVCNCEWNKEYWYV